MEKSCSVWLGEYLMSEGAVLCDEVRKQARSQGYRSSDLKKARKEGTSSEDISSIRR